MTRAIDIDSQAFELDIDIQAGVAAPLPYSTPAIDFDGSNDFFNRGADLTGNADSGKGIIVFSFRRDGDGSFQTIYSTPSPFRIIIRFNDDNAFLVKLHNAAGAGFSQETTETYTADGVWRTCAIGWDFSNPVSADNWIRCLIDGVVVISDDDVPQRTIANSSTDHLIGTLATQFFNGCLADVWVHFGEFLDFSIQANHDLFFQNGTPVDKGANGETPLGFAPLVYLKTPDGANLGTGGNFIPNGVPSTCSTSPTD